MTYRKQDRPTWYVRLKLPGLGKVGPLSTGTTQRDTARRIEAFVREAGLTRPDLVRGLMEKRYSLAEMWVAHLSGATDTLLQQRNDPLIADKAREFLRGLEDHRVIGGVGHLLRLIPAGARLSLITRPTDPLNPAAPSGAKEINRMIGALRAEGMKANSIARSFYTATSAFLRFTVGNKARNDVFVDVPMPYEDDTRDAHLTTEEIERLLSSCSDYLYPVVVFAMLSGLDRGPIARMQPRDFDADTDELVIRDTKNAARQKREKLSDTAAALIRAQAWGRAPDGPLWDVNYDQIDKEFQAAKRAAKMTEFRFKDLRHLAATFAGMAGMNARELQDFLRHKTGRMALRYLSKLPNQRKDKLNAQAEALGLSSAHLRKKGGAA